FHLSSCLLPRPRTPTLFPYTTLFRSALGDEQGSTALHYAVLGNQTKAAELLLAYHAPTDVKDGFDLSPLMLATRFGDLTLVKSRSEEHTSELQSLRHLVCRLLLEKKN